MFRGMYVGNLNWSQPNVRLAFGGVGGDCGPSFSCHLRVHVVYMGQRSKEMLTATRIM
jgi:hypothetical protein